MPMMNRKHIFFIILCFWFSSLGSKESADLEFSEIESADFESLDLDSLLEEEERPRLRKKARVRERSKKERDKSDSMDDIDDSDALVEEEKPKRRKGKDVVSREKSDKLDSMDDVDDLDALVEGEKPKRRKRKDMISREKGDKLDSMDDVDDLDALVDGEKPKRKKKKRGSMTAMEESDELDSLDLDALIDSGKPQKKGKRQKEGLSLPKDWEADKKLQVSRKFGDGFSGEDLEVLRLEKVFDEDRLREINLQKLEGKKIIDLGIREKIEKGAIPQKAKSQRKAKDQKTGKGVVQNSVVSLNKDESDFNFNLSEEEKKLLGLAQYVEKKVSSGEWDEVATKASDDKYIVQTGDWLWKISERLFGTGFYYPKLWSINPHITNPHQIEPGMVLVFTTGSSDELPEVQLGTFEEEGNKGKKGKKAKVAKKDPEASVRRITVNLKKYGQDLEPPWMKKRQKLLKEGYYFEYATEETYEDLEEIGKLSLQDDYKRYNPPVPKIIVVEPDEGNAGFDKDSIVDIDIKEGLALTTFLTKDAIVDLGEIVELDKEMGYILVKERERLYVKFNDDSNVQVGDFFSIYKFGGPVHYKYSDRQGYRYTITGHIKVIKKFKEYWEVEVHGVRDVIERNERITFYVPKLRKSSDTFNRRTIEAAVIGAYAEGRTHMSMGDIVYLDRGRADGVEMGNVFQVYSSLKKDRHEDFPKKNIGMLRVVTLMDDFSTALVTGSADAILIGALASTYMEGNAQLASEGTGGGANDVNIELHLKDSVKDVLANAEKVKLTEDELQELDREEEKYSVLDDDERDLRELERLESEIVAAEKILAESRGDEDKFLESESLDKLEKEREGKKVAEDFAPVDDIEGEVGLKFLDQELNSRENPYGLTEFDLEEVEELFNNVKL